jgi:hypothetical protein
LRRTKSRPIIAFSHVPLDQLVTIDYNVQQWNYVETIGNKLLEDLSKKVIVLFQNTND